MTEPSALKETQSTKPNQWPGLILFSSTTVVLAEGTLLPSHRQSNASILVHGQVTIIFVVSVGMSVCLFVCAELFSAVFDPISIKLGHMLYVWV